MTTTFDDIVANLTPTDFHIVRSYILDTVRAEFGPLIQSLSEQSYAQTEIRSDEDQVHETGETTENLETREETFSMADLFGKRKPSATEHDQHLRFHALQSALAFCHETDKDPMVHANLFYGFLKGDA